MQKLVKMLAAGLLQFGGIGTGTGGVRFMSRSLKRVGKTVG